MNDAFALARNAAVRRGVLQIVGAWSLAIAGAFAAYRFVRDLYGPLEGYVPWLLFALPCAVVVLVTSLFVLECRESFLLEARTTDRWSNRGLDGQRGASRPDPLRRAPLRLGFWGATSAVADTVAIHLTSNWTRGISLELGALWICTALTSAWLLANALTALGAHMPVSRLDPPRDATAGLRERFLITTVGCCAQVVAVPLLVLSLWLNAPHLAIAEAEATAHRIAAHVETQAWELLGKELATRSDIKVRLDERTLGNEDIRMPVEPTTDALDVERDGRVDVVLHTVGENAVAVSVPPAPSGLLLVLAGAGLVTLVIFGLLAMRLARALQRDVSAASVASGILGHDGLPPLAGSHPLQLEEVHQLMHRVSQLMASASEATVASYVAIERVKEAERLKGQFLANMSHDLRSPLNSILGFSELLLNGIDGPITEEQREMLEPIHRSGRALLEQIDDILDTAKLESGKLEMHEEATPVATLLGRAIHIARQRQGPSIEYQVDVAPGLPPALVDPHRTVQALVDVLVFAQGPLERGTITLRVRLGSSGKGRTIFIEVYTPVRPATAEQLAKVRRGFYRIPGHRGLGLQLPLAAAILELQGGGLGIEDLGSAMTFTLHLKAPVVRASLAVVER